VTGTDTVDVPAKPTALIGLTKLADPRVVHHAGDLVTYSFEISNEGDSTLNNVALIDPMLTGVTFDDIKTTATGEEAPYEGWLAPGEHCYAKATYTSLLSDINGGSWTNTATATAVPAGSQTRIQAVDMADVEAPPAPAIELKKQAGEIQDVDGNGPDAGDTVAYSFVVTNKGNVTLSDVHVSDPIIGAVKCPDAVLAADASMTCTGTRPYVLSQADVDAGTVHNVAVVVGTPPVGIPATDDDSHDVDIVQRPAIELTKTAGAIADANNSGSPDAGDTVTYAFRITNTGNVTLTEVRLDDDLLGLDDLTCGTAELAPGQTTGCTSAPYVLTQADLEAHRVHNVASVTGTAPGGGSVDDEDDAVVTIPTKPTKPTKPPVTPTPQPGLPNTGSDVAPWLIALATLSTLSGAVLLWKTRR